jgi:hypothetical protein
MASKVTPGMPPRDEKWANAVRALAPVSIEESTTYDCIV